MARLGRAQQYNGMWQIGYALALGARRSLFDSGHPDSGTVGLGQVRFGEVGRGMDLKRKVCDEA